MTAPWTTLLAIAGVGLLFVVLPVAGDVFAQYRRRRVVRCPEEGVGARIRIDAAHAALTSVPGPARLRVTGCSLWPARADCAQRCVAGL